MNTKNVQDRSKVLQEGFSCIINVEIYSRSAPRAPQKYPKSTLGAPQKRPSEHPRTSWGSSEHRIQSGICTLLERSWAFFTILIPPGVL